MTIEIDPTYTYEIIENTLQENLAVGAWNGIDHNVTRWQRTNDNDQRFLFLPINQTKKFKIVSLREDVHERVYVSIEARGNCITWSGVEGRDQEFEPHQVNDQQIAFVEKTKNEFLDVDFATGNIQRWEGDKNGHPKSNQLFRLIKREKWTPPEIPSALLEFKEAHPEKFSEMVNSLKGIRINRNVAHAMNQIDKGTWEKIINVFTSKGAASENKIRDILATIGFVALFIGQAIIIILAMLGVIVLTGGAAAILAIIGAILGIYIALGQLGFTLMVLWWKDPEPLALPMISTSPSSA